MTHLLGPYREYLHATLRIVAGYAFSLHGMQKLFGVLGSDGVPLLSLLGVAGTIEVVGGLLLVLGLFTRAVAFVASGEMAVAYFMAHVGANGNLLFPLLNGGEPAVLYCFIFLYLAAAGPGACSLDARRR